MGKASLQRRIKRARYLARLASKEPERFNEAWEKRLSSWLEQIGKDAGRLHGLENRSLPPVFDRVDEAMRVLQHCGEEIYRQYAPEAWELLSTECCRQFGRWVDPSLFRINHYKWLDPACRNLSQCPERSG